MADPGRLASSPPQGKLWEHRDKFGIRAYVSGQARKVGSSPYRVGEAEAMLSLCLCASVVLLEMLAIIIPAVTESNRRDTEAQSKKRLDEIES
jgi:hypothetical protein